MDVELMMITKEATKSPLPAASSRLTLGCCISLEGLMQHTSDLPRRWCSSVHRGTSLANNRSTAIPNCQGGPVDSKNVKQFSFKNIKNIMNFPGNFYARLVDRIIDKLFDWTMLT